jgi:hypothetical protein
MHDVTVFFFASAQMIYLSRVISSLETTPEGV